MWDDGKNPFAYPILTYVWVIGLACFGGVVRHLNQMSRFSPSNFFIDLITSGFTGLITFWLCEWGNIQGPLGAVLIATSGMMGNRAWQEIERLWKIRMYAAAGVSPPSDSNENGLNTSDPTDRERNHGM